MTAALAVSLLQDAAAAGMQIRRHSQYKMRHKLKHLQFPEETAGKAAGTEEVSKSCSPEELTGTVVIWDWDGGTTEICGINLMRYTPM